MTFQEALDALIGGEISVTLKGVVITKGEGDILSFQLPGKDAVTKPLSEFSDGVALREFTKTYALS